MHHDKHNDEMTRHKTKQTFVLEGLKAALTIIFIAHFAINPENIFQNGPIKMSIKTMRDE
jgi:hypothetical protein